VRSAPKISGVESSHCFFQSRWQRPIEVEDALKSELGIRDAGFRGVVTKKQRSCFLELSLFDTSAHADESTRLASSWVRDEKLESALPNAPKITFGEVIARSKTDGAVRA
jgi:hypothetical protein